MVNPGCIFGSRGGRGGRHTPRAPRLLDPPVPQGSPVQNEAQAAARVADQARVVIQSAPFHQSDAYDNEQKAFKLWVDGERSVGNLARGPKYLTRANIDAYFVRVVTRRMITPPRCQQGDQQRAQADSPSDGPQTIIDGGNGNGCPQHTG